MKVIFRDEIVQVRELRDCDEDYDLFVSWLSDPEVCSFYEGRTKIFNYEMILEKFQDRAKGYDPVTVGIIEFDDQAIGFIQFYRAVPGEYQECDVVDPVKYPRSYGMDIVIGDKRYWNKGVGTHTIKLLNKFLFSEKQADVLLIAPQTWNKRAISCYEKCGFKQIKIIKDMELHDDEYEDGVLMVNVKGEM